MHALISFEALCMQFVSSSLQMLLGEALLKALQACMDCLPT